MKVNEIFYSLQGEGFHTGTPAVFLRLSGCNLRCPFCDTHHEEGREMTENEIVAQVSQYPSRFLVITGGEPSLFLTASLVDALHREGWRVHVETNGTHRLPENVDWVTLSPKDAFAPNAEPVTQRYDELKVVYNGTDEPREYKQFHILHRFLQPCDVGDATANRKILHATIHYIKLHPQWRLSLQTHKTLDIP